MCTAVSLRGKNHFFGRNLDYEYGFGEQIIITPRNYPFHFKNGSEIVHHYAIIGMAVAADNYPLYFDATNEKGLSIAGLNFPDNAHYYEPDSRFECITPFELIPWILCKCKSTDECIALCKNIRITNISFNERYGLTPLHWIVADKDKTIVIESVQDGIHIYDNPYRVLTNNPPFPYHLYNICNYMNVTAEDIENHFAPNESIKAYSRGMGGIGLPGDNSSASRFIRAAFTLLNSKPITDEHSGIVQFFHILNTVCQVEGCTQVGKQYEKTLYTSCCNTDKGIYYYTTYDNPQISAVHLYHADLSQKDLISVPINKKLDIFTSL